MDVDVVNHSTVAGTAQLIKRIDVLVDNIAHSEATGGIDALSLLSIGPAALRFPAIGANVVDCLTSEVTTPVIN